MWTTRPLPDAPGRTLVTPPACPRAARAARDHHDAEQPCSRVRADHGADLGHQQPGGPRKPLAQPLGQLLGPLRGTEVVHRQVRRSVTGGPHRQLHQPLRGPRGRPHLLQRHDPPLRHVQQRLHRQRRADQRGRRADPAAAAQPVQGVHAEEHPAPGRDVRGCLLHAPRRRPGSAASAAASTA